MSRNGVRKEVVFKHSEWEVIKNKAEKFNITPTEVIRQGALQSFILINDYRNLDTAIYEINKIGNNINQIAKKTNQTNNITADEIDYLKEKVNDIWLLLNQYPYIKM